MTESSKFTLEKFVDLNITFFKTNKPYIISVDLRLFEKTNSSYKWALKFKYEMKRGTYWENGMWNEINNGKHIEEVFNKYLRGFSDHDYQGKAIFSFAREKDLSHFVSALQWAKDRFIKETGHSIDAIDEISGKILEQEEIARIQEQEFLDNDFPFEEWCENFIDKNVKNPLDDAHYLEYNEKLVEETIRDFPNEFIEESLNLLSQQELLFGFRPDLVFKNDKDEVIIVEIQLGRLDKNHLYKSLEYRRFYKLKHSQTNVRVMLISEELPNKYLQILEEHRIEHITISRNYFLNKIKNIKPDLKILGVDPSPNDSKKLYGLSQREVINIVKSKGENNIKINGKALYYFRYNKNEEVEPLNFLSCEKLGKHYEHLYSPSRRDFYKGPMEIIIEEQSFNELKSGLMELIWVWVSNLERHHTLENYFDYEIVLGFRGAADYYNYESYVSGRINDGFSLLWNRYMQDFGYNREKIRSDLTQLNAFILYANKYPNYSALPFFENFEIIDGPGHLEKNWEIIWNNTKDAAKYRAIDLDAIYKDYKWMTERYKWTTIKLSNISTAVLNTLVELIYQLNINETTIRWEGWDDYRHFLSPPINLKDISEEALILTSAYFKNIKKARKLNRIYTKRIG